MRRGFAKETRVGLEVLAAAGRNGVRRDVQCLEYRAGNSVDVQAAIELRNSRRQPRRSRYLD